VLNDRVDLLRGRIFHSKPKGPTMIGQVVVAVILIMTFAAPVFAGPKSPGVDRREHKQKQRIKQGIKSGALTKEEGRALTAEQKAIRAKEREMKSDGSLTREERKERIRTSTKPAGTLQSRSTTRKHGRRKG